ncbi:hypothetical protein HMPREF9552_05065 [Escherichia coli MS 198-1]|nr:hypothetical protein HMPREF9552_05065 [Escherichia coli MS 198-1]
MWCEYTPQIASPAKYIFEIKISYINRMSENPVAKSENVLF